MSTRQTVNEWRNGAVRHFTINDVRQTRREFCVLALQSGSIAARGKDERMLDDRSVTIRRIS